MNDIAIFGAGGYGREIACLINAINQTQKQWNLIGFFDDAIPADTPTPYGPIIGGLERLNQWERPLAVAIAIATPKTLQKIHSNITNPLIYFPNLISPDTVFFDLNNTCLGRGNIITLRSVLSTNVSLGNFNILNSYITIGHDSSLGDYNCLMTSTHIAGGINIGNRNFFGVNSVVLQYLDIADDITIGAASVVMRSIKKPGTYIGNPAKIFNF